jgi:hypothetical protein
MFIAPAALTQLSSFRSETSVKLHRALKELDGAFECLVGWKHSALNGPKGLPQIGRQTRDS